MNKFHKYSRAACSAIIIAYIAFMIGYENMNLAMGIVWAVLTAVLAIVFSNTSYERYNERSAISLGAAMILTNIALFFVPQLAFLTIPLGIFGVIDIVNILRTKYRALDRKSIIKNELKTLLWIVIFIIYLLGLLYITDIITDNSITDRI